MSVCGGNSVMLTLEEQHARYKAARARMEAAGREHERQAVLRPPVKVIDLTQRKLDMAERARREQAAEREALIAETRAKVLSELGIDPDGHRLRQWKVWELVDLVSGVTGVSLYDIYSQRRSFRIVKARQIVMWLCRRFSSKSLPDIGRRLEGRDHTTVLHGANKVERLIAAHVGSASEETPQAWAEHLWRADWKATVIRPTEYWEIVRPDSQPDLWGEMDA